MTDDWMTDEHKAAALEGWLGNPVAAAHEGRRPIGLMPDLWPWLQEQVLRDKEDLEEVARLRKVNAPFKAWHRSVPDEIFNSERPDEAWLEAAARVEARGRVLMRHRLRWHGDADTAWATARCCVGCGYVGPVEVPVTDDLNNCPELRDMAVAFRHREGYRQEWAP